MCVMQRLLCSSSNNSVERRAGFVQMDEDPEEQAQDEYIASQ